MDEQDNKKKQIDIEKTIRSYLRNNHSDKFKKESVDAITGTVGEHLKTKNININLNSINTYLHSIIEPFEDFFKFKLPKLKEKNDALIIELKPELKPEPKMLPKGTLKKKENLEVKEVKVKEIKVKEIKVKEVKVKEVKVKEVKVKEVKVKKEKKSTSYEMYDSCDENDESIIQEVLAFHNNIENSNKSTSKKYTDLVHGPYSSSWINDNPQVDDDISHPEIIKRANALDRLLAVKFFEQRTIEWFEQRRQLISASDIGTVLQQNKSEPEYKFLFKKILPDAFKGNKFTAHGVKYETISSMIFCYRMNVTCHDFGLCQHREHLFLGASPDNVVSHYKHDGVHLTDKVGLGLEIKCPYSRTITDDLDIEKEVPYYYSQVLLQLECCDLEECAFWQTKIEEYNSREEFVTDTDPDEQFRTRDKKLEKGAVIQFLSEKELEELRDRNKVGSPEYWELVYNKSKYIYPPKIEMTPYEYDEWATNQINNFKTDPDLKYLEGYAFDKIIYWRLEKSKNVIIKRDREWFSQNLPKFQKMWNYVLYFRNNPDKFTILQEYVDSLSTKYNKKIMEVVEHLSDESHPMYQQRLVTINKTTIANKLAIEKEKEKEMKEALALKSAGLYEFIVDSDSE
jgi:putative phage-type endonuclease